MENNYPNPESNKNENKPPETDSEKIIRRHLENEDDEITDEDIRGVRISGETEEPVTTGAEAKARFIKDKPDETDEDNPVPDPNAKPTTPWDVLGE